MRLLRVKDIHPTESEQMKAHYRKVISTEAKSRNQERETSSAAMLLELPLQLGPRVITGHGQTSSSCLCSSDPPLLFTAAAQQDRFPHSFSGVACVLCPTDVRFPSDCPEAQARHIEEQSTLLSALVSSLLIAFTPSCVIFKLH